METHIDIDQDVLATVRQLGRFVTQREAVPAAFTDMARRLAARQLLDMGGQIDIEADAPSMRESRCPAWDAAH